MATDDERREVAEGLRGLVTDDSVYATINAGHVLYAIGLCFKDVDRIYFSGYDVARLANLIEPSCDREALLALADEMDRDGRLQRERQKSGEQWFIDGLDVREYARRIRKACGEVES